MSQILFVLTERVNGQFADHWRTCESMPEADALYAKAIKAEATYTASIAVCVKSTDYECMTIKARNEDRRACLWFALALILLLIAPAVGAFLRSLPIYN